MLPPKEMLLPPTRDDAFSSDDDESTDRSDCLLRVTRQEQQDDNGGTDVSSDNGRKDNVDTCIPRSLFVPDLWTPALYSLIEHPKRDTNQTLRPEQRLKPPPPPPRILQPICQRFSPSPFGSSENERSHSEWPLSELELLAYRSDDYGKSLREQSIARDRLLQFITCPPFRNAVDSDLDLDYDVDNDDDSHILKDALLNELIELCGHTEQQLWAHSGKAHRGEGDGDHECKDVSWCLNDVLAECSIDDCDTRCSTFSWMDSDNDSIEYTKRRIERKRMTTETENRNTGCNHSHKNDDSTGIIGALPRRSERRNNEDQQEEQEEARKQSLRN